MEMKELNLQKVMDNQSNWVSIAQMQEWFDLQDNPFDHPKLLIINSELGYLPKVRNGVVTFHIDAFKRCYPQFNYDLKN